MARAPRVLVPPEEMPADEIGDDLTDAEIEQAAVGDLFTIQGPEFVNVSWSIWRFRTRAEMAADSQGQAEEWVADRTGELHGTDLGEVIGGGTFRFRGFVPRTDGRGVRLAFNRIIAIAGPRKNFALPPADATPAAPAAPANGLTRGEKLLLRMLRLQEQRLQQLERTPPPAQNSTSIKELAETMVLLNGMTAKPPASDSTVAKELFNSMMAATKTGIELGQARDPLPADEENVTVKVIEAVAPLASRFLDVLTQARARQAVRPNPPTQPGPSPAAASTAEVVGEPASVPVITVTDARWTVAVDNLMRSIAESDPLEDAADDLETALLPGDLAGVLASTNDQVMAALLERYSAQYPILAEPRAREYVGNVLDELRTAPTADAQ
jgi:hypothetical protein